MAASTDRCASSRPGRRSPEDKLVDSLIALMEAGTTPWRRPWDGDSRGHHVNLLSGRRYRGGNPVLLSFGMHLRNSTLPYWCGFAEAKARGLTPRRGSQAVYVLRPQVIPTREAQPKNTTISVNNGPGIPTADGDATRATETGGVRSEGSGAGLPRVLYRPIPVFNAADLEGGDLTMLIRMRRAAAHMERRSPTDRLKKAEEVLERWPVPVLPGGDHACYVPDTDRIHLPDRSSFHNPAAHLATWGHEAIHSTGHPSRLGRDLSGVMGAADARGQAYAREELVAELGAVLLGERLEIGSDTRNHAAYLSHWVALLRESPRLLLKLLSQARQAADLICPEADRAASAPEPSSHCVRSQ
jgi:antirestriction protein ArdC